MSNEPYSVWSFEKAIQNGGDDGYPDRIAMFARAVLLGNENDIHVRANEIGVRAHPMAPLPVGFRWPPAASLPSTKRGAQTALIRLMYVRDRYVCRYCGTRVIDLRVLEALSKASAAYGAIFPRGPAWRLAETHPAFWWQSGSNDHLVPRARGGEVNDFENLVTACWPCQHRKSNATLVELRWQLRPVAPGAPAQGSTLAEWDGLVELLQPLKALVAVRVPKVKKQPRTAIWRRNTRGAYPARVVGKDPWVYEARNGLWRVKAWPKAQPSRRWELLRLVAEEWMSFAFFPSSDLALKIAADTDDKDGIGPAVA